MDPITKMMLAGTAFQLAAGFGANLQQAVYEAENAQIYREQADLARAAMERELEVADREYAYQYGNTVSGYAAAGVDVGSGSAADVIGSVSARRIEELSAIRQQGELQIKIASSRGMRAQREANTLGSAEYNLMQAGGTILTNYNSYLRSQPVG